MPEPYARCNAESALSALTSQVCRSKEVCSCLHLPEHLLSTQSYNVSACLAGSCHALHTTKQCNPKCRCANAQVAWSCHAVQHTTIGRAAYTTVQIPSDGVLAATATPGEGRGVAIHALHRKERVAPRVFTLRPKIRPAHNNNCTTACTQSVGFPDRADCHPSCAYTFICLVQLSTTMSVSKHTDSEHYA